MADAWNELQQALRELRKPGDIRYRLAHAYRWVVRLKSKDVPLEVRADFEWLMKHLGMSPLNELAREIRTTVNRFSDAQLSEAVNRLVRLHQAVERYQPVAVPVPQRWAASRVATSRKVDKTVQPDLWDFA